MGKLVGVSFIGIDERTDLVRLQEIQKKYPFAEFGIILSVNWKDNGNRYYNPNELGKFKGLGLNLSAHLCGSVARAAIKNDWEPAFDILGLNSDIFSRVQLNIAKYVDAPKALELDVPAPFSEVIIQQKAAYNCPLFFEWYLKNHSSKISVLIDGSGGLGIDTPIIPLVGVPKVGYAGGIGPDNVEEKNLTLAMMTYVYDYWLDMESKVRTDDWFDLDKVEQVCSSVNKSFERWV